MKFIFDMFPFNLLLPLSIHNTRGDQTPSQYSMFRSRKLLETVSWNRTLGQFKANQVEYTSDRDAFTFWTTSALFFEMFSWFLRCWKENKLLRKYPNWSKFHINFSLRRWSCFPCLSAEIMCISKMSVECSISF